MEIRGYISYGIASHYDSVARLKEVAQSPYNKIVNDLRDRDLSDQIKEAFKEEYAVEDVSDALINFATPKILDALTNEDSSCITGIDFDMYQDIHADEGEFGYDYTIDANIDLDKIAEEFMREIVEPELKMSKIKCIAMVGPSGSGKSTLSKKLKSIGYEVFSSDEYRKRYYGAEEIQANPKFIFERLYADAAHSLKEGWDIVIDATNIKPADRVTMLNTILAISQKTRSEIEFIAIDFSDVSLSECLENNKKRSRHVPEEVIAKQFLIYKQHPITENDNFDSVYYSKSDDILQKVIKTTPIVSKTNHLSKEEHEEDLEQ